jgi:hypothetical protein
MHAIGTTSLKTGKTTDTVTNEFKDTQEIRINGKTENHNLRKSQVAPECGFFPILRSFFPEQEIMVQTHAAVQSWV